MAIISDLLTLTWRNGASDLHLSSNKPPIMRINGEMTVINEFPALSGDQVKNLLYSIMSELQRTTFEKELDVDFALSFSDSMRFRVNVFNTIDGSAAVFRTIPSKILTLEQLGTPAIIEALTNKHKGLILLTGPTGSGKSTTLAAMINHINETQKKHIITIEDPIEFVHTSKSCLINQRETGAHTMSFAKALRSALREDPDVILVGELRDLETIQLALTAAETGHLVFSTLHTNSAPKTIDRIIDVFPANDKEMIRSMLSGSLEAVITQTLLKKKDGNGRVAAHEIMLSTPAIRNLIREGKIAQMNSAIQMGSKIGMISMKDAVYKLVENNIIDKETALTVVSEKVDEKQDASANYSNTNRNSF